jgi:hypothetical protein
MIFYTITPSDNSEAPENWGVFSHLQQARAHAEAQYDDHTFQWDGYELEGKAIVFGPGQTGEVATITLHKIKVQGVDE